MTANSSSLIVVSNRLPFVLSRRDDETLYRKPSAGGLVTAVAPVMVQSGGKLKIQTHLIWNAYSIFDTSDGSNRC